MHALRRMDSSYAVSCSHARVAALQCATDRGSESERCALAVVQRVRKTGHGLLRRTNSVVLPSTISMMRECP